MADSRNAIQIALSERYEVRSHLGTGGMAEVYRARDLRHGRDVALKVIREEITAAIGLDRFLREIAITSRLTHPHIRSLLDSGEAAGRLWYAMPFVSGETLRDRLKREGALGLEDTLRIGRELADALAYAHGEDVIHRDVKPSNIILEGEHAVLSDFGIAVAADAGQAERLTESGIVIGTPEYMSPEQCGSGRAVDRRADIYSLGCVLYEMLTGQPPFTGRTRVAIIAKQIGETAPSPAILRPDLPIEVAELLQRCLAKVPGDRFATAGQLRDAIDAALAAWLTGTSRGPATAAGPKRGWKPLHRAVAGFAAVAVVGTTAWWAFKPRPPPPDPDRVMVFPLVDRGGGEAAGSPVAMMIVNALQHADPLIAADGYDYLSPEQRVDPAQLSLQEARSIARAERAGSFITGGVTRGRDSTSVRLVLHDSRTGSERDSGSHTESTALLSPDQIGIRAMIELLGSLIDPERSMDMSVLTDRDPAAVALWIRGDLEYRMARFETALSRYSEAVEMDSALVFAALKGAQAASWSERPDLAGELARHAVANDTILPERYRYFARGLEAYLEGKADSAVALFRAALDLDPEWSEAWMALGEVYQHLLPSDLRAGVSAPDAFERAARDPGFAPPLVHLSEYSVRRGERGMAGELVRRLRDSGAEGAAGIAKLALVLDCAANGPEPETWSREADRDVGVVREAAGQLAVGAAFPACAEAAYRAILAQPDISRANRWAASMGLQGILVAEGRNAEAQAVLDEAIAAGIGVAHYLAPLDVLAGGDLNAGAERFDSIARDLWAPSYDGVGGLTLWVIGTWQAHLGDLRSLDTVRTRLSGVEFAEGESHKMLAVGLLDARRAVLTGDTLKAIELLRSSRAAGTRNELLTSMYQAFPAERLLLAQLLLARGEFEEAYWTAAAFDHPQPLLFPAFVPAGLVVQIRAASQLRGAIWQDRAENARRRLEALDSSLLKALS